MAKYNSLGELFTATANAIRAKTGGADPIVAEDFPVAIDGIEVGGSGGDVVIGTFTPAEDITEITFDTGGKGASSYNLFIVTAISNIGAYETALDFYKTGGGSGILNSSSQSSVFYTNKSENYANRTSIYNSPLSVTSATGGPSDVRFSVPAKYPYANGCVFKGGEKYVYIFAKV